MKFKKGHIAWNRGITGVESHLYGRKLSKKTKDKMSIAKKGISLSVKHRKKLSLGHLKNPTKYWLGKGEQRKGENSPNWKGGITKYEAVKRWRTKNRTKTNFMNRERSYLKRGAVGSHTFEEWEKLKELYGYACLSCKQNEPEVKLTEDHIVPITKGGSDYIENIQPLCINCNCKKSTKTIDFRKGGDFYHNFLS